MTPRENLIQQGYITDLPLIKRAHNWARKDIKLTPAQVEMLYKEYKIVLTINNTEKEALSQLRSLKWTPMYYKKALVIN